MMIYRLLYYMFVIICILILIYSAKNLFIEARHNRWHSNISSILSGILIALFNCILIPNTVFYLWFVHDFTAMFRRHYPDAWDITILYEVAIITFILALALAKLSGRIFNKFLSEKVIRYAAYAASAFLIMQPSIIYGLVKILIIWLV